MDTNIIGNTTSSITAATDIFISLYNAAAGTNTLQLASSFNIMPIAGTFQNFYIQCDAGPGVGITRTFWIYINGSNTGISIALAGAGTGAGVSSGSDLADTAAFAAGDIVSLRTSATATTTSAGTIRWCLTASSATANQSMVLSNVGATNLSGTLTNYVAVSGKGVDTTAATNVQGIIPTSGTFQNAYMSVGAGSSPGTGTSYTATLYQNGSPTAITMAIAGNSAITASDTAHSVSVSPGDIVYWSVAPSGTPAARPLSLSMEFDPTVNGESIHMYGNSVADTNTSARYNVIASSNLATYPSTEPSRQSLTMAAVWQKLYVNLASAPGVSASFQVQLSINGTAGNPSVTISDANTTGSDAGTAVSTAGQTVVMKLTPTNTPAASTLSWGIVSYIAPPGLTKLSYYNFG